MAQTRDWKGMKDMSARLLQERTGQDLETWNQRITSEGFADEPQLRAWLTAAEVSDDIFFISILRPSYELHHFLKPHFHQCSTSLACCWPLTRCL